MNLVDSLSLLDSPSYENEQLTCRDGSAVTPTLTVHVSAPAPTPSAFSKLPSTPFSLSCGERSTVHEDSFSVLPTHQHLWTRSWHDKRRLSRVMAFQASELALEAIHSLQPILVRLREADSGLADPLRRAAQSLALNLDEIALEQGEGALVNGGPFTT